MMQKPFRPCTCVAVCVFFPALLLPQFGFSGEPPGPGLWRGSYHVDRWRRHRFIGSGLAVSPKLEKRLKVFAGRPADVKVTRVEDHPTGDPSKGMITAFGAVKLRPAVVGLDVEWDMGAKGKPPRMLRVKAGQNVKIRITIVNLTVQPLSLEKASLLLGFDRMRPSGTGRTDALDYWPGFYFRWFTIWTAPLCFCHLL